MEKIDIYKLFTLYFLYFFIVDALEITIPLYFEEIGIAATIMGLIFSLANGIRFTSSIFMIFKKYNYRIILFFIFFLLGFAALIFSLSQHYLLLTVFSILVFSTRSLFNINLNPVLLYSVSYDERGKLMGTRDIFLYSGSALGLFFCGYIVQTSFLGVFILLFVLAILSIFIICFIKKDEINEDTKSHITSEKVNYKLIFKNKTILKFCLLGFLGSFISGNLFLVPLLGNSIGVTYEHIFYTFTGSTIIAAILSYSGGIITDKFNKKVLLVVNMIFDLVMYVFLFLADSTVLFIICLGLMSIQYIFAPVFSVFFSEFFNKEEGEIAWKILVPFMLLAEMISPILWGIIWDSSLQQYTFLLTSGLIIFELILFILLFFLPKRT